MPTVIAAQAGTQGERMVGVTLGPRLRGGDEWKVRMLSVLPQLVVSGTSTGMLYALIALSMTVVYRATTVVNFGHGDMVAAGAYAVFVFGLGFGLPFLVAMTLAIALLFAAGVAAQRVLMQPIVAGPHLSLAMMALAIGYTLRGAMRLEWGNETINPQRPYPQDVFLLGNVVVTMDDVVICGVGSAAAGRAVRAVAGDAARQGDPGDLPESARRGAGRHQRPAVPRADVGRRRGARRGRRRDAVAHRAADARPRPMDAGAAALPR